MTPQPEVQGYLGRLVDDTGAAVGTCFQIEPGVVATAWHVVDSLGAGRKGDIVHVGSLAGGTVTPAVVHATDPKRDLAVLRCTHALSQSIAGLTATESVRPTTPVAVRGVSDFVDANRFESASTTGVWQGGAVREGGVAVGQMDAAGLVRGMSGAPVCKVADDLVVGVVSSRYNSPTARMRDTVWIARTEDLEPLLFGLSRLRVDRGTFARLGSGVRRARGLVLRGAGLLGMIVTIGLVVAMMIPLAFVVKDAVSSESRQGEYQSDLNDSREALLSGQVAVKITDVLEPGEFGSLVVKVCGTEALCRPSVTASSSFDAVGSPKPTGVDIPAASPSIASIKIGGQVRVRATTDMPGDLIAQSAEVQPIIAAADVGTWIWTVRPSEQGDFFVRIFVTVLYADTSNALLPDESFTVPLYVILPAPGQPYAPPWWWGVHLQLAFLLIAVAATVAVVTALQWYRARGPISLLRLRWLRQGVAPTGVHVRPSKRAARREYERAEAEALFYFRQQLHPKYSELGDDIIVQLALLGAAYSDTTLLSIAIRLYAPLSDHWPESFRSNFVRIHEIAENAYARVA